MSAFEASFFMEGVGHPPFTDSFACKLEAPVSDFSMRQWNDEFEGMYEQPDIKGEDLEAGDCDYDSLLCDGEEDGMRLMHKYSQLTKRKPIESMRRKVIAIQPETSSKGRRSLKLT
jgi:hypothetical protein